MGEADNKASPPKIVLPLTILFIETIILDYIWQILSNGKYKAVFHRTTVCEKTRMSWPVFLEPPANQLVGPHPKLLNDQNPPKFKTKPYADYAYCKLNKIPQWNSLIRDHVGLFRNNWLISTSLNFFPPRNCYLMLRWVLAQPYIYIYIYRYSLHMK